MKFRKTIKSTTCMTLDADVMAELRLRRINVSALVNDFLISYVGKKEEVDPKEKDDLIQEIAIAKNRIRSLEEKKEQLDKKQSEEEEYKKKNWIQPMEAI